MGKRVFLMALDQVQDLVTFSVESRECRAMHIERQCISPQALDERSVTKDSGRSTRICHK